MNMDFKRKLPTPLEVKNMYPVREDLVKVKEKNDIEIQNIIKGESDKLLLIIGPCSADREDAVIDYMHRLRKVQDEVSDVIKIVPRLYTNKPRTTGDGYLGMLHQPDPLASPDMLKGIITIRKLHMRVLEETGFTCADELLYTENHRYLSDLLSYVAVGARSVEDQSHRLTASGLDIPVGMKNPTSGNLSVMMNAILAGHHSHTFLYRGWEVTSKGNPLTHAVLRGYINADGIAMPNYHYEDLKKLAKIYKEYNFPYPAIIIDTNHCNSNKNYLEQANIAKEVLDRIKDDKELSKMIKGFMIESYIEDGCQDERSNVYGKSITDPCLGWDKTIELINELANIKRINKQNLK